MENPDIKDIVKHVDENKNKSLDAKEWLLISKLFDVQPKELKTDVQIPTSTDKFMSRQEQEQIAEQKKMNNDIKKENKEIISYNKDVDRLKKSLENPKIVTKLLEMMLARIKLIKNKEDIFYYEKFLNVVKNNIKDRFAPEITMTEDYEVQLDYANIQINTNSMLDSLLQKEKELGPQKEIITKDNNEINKKQLSGDTQGLKQKLSGLDQKDFLKFKNTINNLKDGKVSVEQLDPLDQMTQILKLINTIDKGSVLNIIDQVIIEKFPDTEQSAEVKGFKDIVGGLLDKKDILNKFVNVVDNDLKGTSYDQLLKQANDPKTLESSDATKGIINLFNRDKGGFDTLIIDFKEKKLQVDLLIREYCAINHRPLSPTATIEKGTKELGVDGNKKEVDCFKIIDPGKETLEVYFGDEETGEAMTISQCLAIDQNTSLKTEDKRLTNAMGIVDNMKTLDPQIKEIMKNTIETASGKKLSLSEALSSFFDSPMFGEFKKIFSMLSLMFIDPSTDKGKNALVQAQLNIALIDLSASIRTGGTMKNKNFDKDGKDLGTTTEYTRPADPNLAKYINGYKFNETNDEKSVFLNCNNLKTQKEYMEAQRDGNSIKVKELFKEMKDKLTISNPNNENKETEKPVIENIEPKEFKNSSNYTELSGDVTKPGKVEKKGEGDNQYLTVDGQIIPLINDKGSVFIKGTDGQIIEKIISFEKKGNKDILNIKNGSLIPSDLTLEKSIDLDDQQKFDAFNFMIGTSHNYGLSKVSNNPELKGLSTDNKLKIEKATADIQRKILQISVGKRNLGDINSLLQGFLKDIAPLLQTLGAKNNNLNSAILKAPEDIKKFVLEDGWLNGFNQRNARGS